MINDGAVLAKEEYNGFVQIGVSMSLGDCKTIYNPTIKLQISWLYIDNFTVLTEVNK